MKFFALFLIEKIMYLLVGSLSSKIWEIIKSGLLVTREICRIGMDIYHFPEGFWKILKNGLKTILLILHPKLKRRSKNRKVIKNRSRRAENRNLKKLGNEMICRKPTGILKSHEENAENVRSGRIGKIPGRAPGKPPGPPPPKKPGSIKEINFLKYFKN